MTAFSRHIRLLPAVIGVGALLLALKGEGLVRQAWAQEQAAPPATATVLAQDTAPLPNDGADDNETSSVAEVDVLSSLSKRRAALDAREAEINARADLLAAAETRIDGKITTLQQLQDKITTLLGQRDSEQEKQVATLVKTYSAMKPKDAARIFDNLADGVLIPVAQAMKPDILAPILAAMTADAAQKLTLKLANRLKLPDLAPPAASTTVAATLAAPSQQASAAPPGAAASP